MPARRLVNAMFVMLLLALAGCAQEGGSPRITAASDQAPERLSDFVDSSELQSAVEAFGHCVEDDFPIVIRFRPEPFNGITTDVASQRMDEDDAVQMVTAKCMAQLDLQRRLSAYQSAHPLSPADLHRLIDEFVSCASDISVEIGARASEANLSSHQSVMRFVGDLNSRGFTSDELVGVSDCEAEMIGPEWVFDEGHPWYTP